MTIIGLSILAGCILILLSAVIINSPGTTKPYLDNNGKVVLNSISEKVYLNIGEVRQGMFIKSKNINNPVLLYIHGGPSFPNYFLFEKYDPGLEDLFTVCYWEQRGGGLSYSSQISIESLTFEQLTSDAIEVSKYLLRRFKKEKLYLMAHSGGTPIAVKAVIDAPHLYAAYIGMAQINCQAESEKLAYNYMIAQYTTDGNSKRLTQLKQYPILKNDNLIPEFYKSALRDRAMHELGVGTMRNIKSVFTGIFIPVWACKAYTFKEKINIWISKFTIVKKAKFVDELFLMDMEKLYPKFDIPVYFFSGKYDLTVNVELSKSYFKKLNAPVKGFYTFNNSAHSPLFEESEKVLDIFKEDILNEKTTLADKLNFNLNN